MTIFKHAGGWINLDHVAEVAPVISMPSVLRVFFTDNPDITFHTDISGSDADRLEKILDALELVVQEPSKPVAKAEPVEVAEGELVQYWGAMRHGKIVIDAIGRPARFISRCEADVWTSRNNISRSVGDQYTVVLIVLSPVATNGKPSNSSDLIDKDRSHAIHL